MTRVIRGVLKLVSGGVGERGLPAAFARCNPMGAFANVVKLEARFVVQVLARLVLLKGVQALFAVLKRVDEVGLHWRGRVEKEKCEMLKVRNER